MECWCSGAGLGVVCFAILAPECVVCYLCVVLLAFLCDHCRTSAVVLLLLSVFFSFILIGGLFCLMQTSLIAAVLGNKVDMVRVILESKADATLRSRPRDSSRSEMVICALAFLIHR